MSGGGPAGADRLSGGATGPEAIETPPGGLRRGFTTGSAAAAATVGAVRFLLGRPCGWILLDLPGGRRISIPLSGVERTPEGARAWVHKDGGDDPDVTDGMAVAAEVGLVPSERPLASLEAGEGVGRVVRPGLPAPVGGPAINPGPRAALEANLGRELPPGLGARVRLSIPGGEAVALRTFNPRLGVVGGLSILGTTGIVEPRSEAALIGTIRAELSVLRAGGAEAVCLVPGNYGRAVAVAAGIPDGLAVATGNFVGEAVDAAARLGFRSILLIAQAGKLLKVSGGSLDTHSARSDGRLCALAAHAARAGASPEEVAAILESNTADEASSGAIGRPWGAEALRSACDAAEEAIRGRALRALGRDRRGGAAEERPLPTGEAPLPEGTARADAVPALGTLLFVLPDRELARSGGAGKILAELTGRRAGKERIP